MIRSWASCFAVILLAGCQPAARLMPVPAVFATGDHSPFAGNLALETSNRVQVFYATNRAPVGPRGSRVYTIVPGQTLYVGNAVVRIGPREKTWEALYALSTTPSAGSRPALKLESLDEVAAIRSGPGPETVSTDARRFFDAVNEVLARSLNKDLTIYVHGSNSTVELAAAQAAQYRHFTGRNSVVLVFIWPSAGSGLRYFTDVRNARLSVPAFTQLYQLLARHTVAEHINVLAYSAGAQIISPGLAALRAPHPNGSPGDWRLGEVYLAAPDVAFPTFVSQLPSYIGAARRITVSANLNDAALGLSRWVNGVSRLGNPDLSELSENDTRWLIDASERFNFDLISVEPEVVPGLGRGSHSFWYDNPWVSSDVLIKMLFHLPPSARGLARNRTEPGFPFWTFPPDYGQRVLAIMRRLRAAHSASKPGGAAARSAEEPETGHAQSTR